MCGREWPRLAVRTIGGWYRPETDSEREEIMVSQELGTWTAERAHRDLKARRVQICPDCLSLREQGKDLDIMAARKHVAQNHRLK